MYIWGVGGVYPNIWGVGGGYPNIWGVGGVYPNFGVKEECILIFGV